jgi:hypothetical protein
MDCLLSLMVIVSVCAFIYGCIAMGPSEEQGGSGSEIVGNAEYGDSGGVSKNSASALPIPMISGKVFCYTRTFIPDTSWASIGAVPRAYTDSSGIFHLLDVPRGEVVVEANDGKGMGYVKTITIDKDSSVFDIKTLTVQKTGGVSIQAHTQLPGRIRFYVSIQGTRGIARGTQADVDISLSDISIGIPYTINVRVFEPVKMEFNVPNIVVPAGGIRILDAFEIR